MDSQCSMQLPWESGAGQSKTAFKLLIKRGYTA
jgi:hypothetical protein